MTEQKSKANWNTAGRTKWKHASDHDVDPHHAAVKHNEPLGRVGIAPAKPVWPSKK